MAASTRSIHSRQRAAGGRSASSTSRLSSPLSLAAARGGGHRPYSRNVGRPGKLARGAERDQPVEQAAGGAVGHRRVARRFGGRDAILGEQEVDDFLGRFRAQFRRDGDQGFERRERSAARSRAAAAARAIAPAAAFGQAGSPGLGRRAAPGGRRAGSRILVAISGTGRGQRSRRARTRSNTQRARISASAAGASGTAAERQGGGLGGRRNRIALPCASLQARCEAVRVHSQVEPRRCVDKSGRDRGWAAGWRHHATATEGSPRARAGRRRRSAGRAARLRRR